ncbi:unnamed protein product [Owenia fusiformis]|uniref:Centrosomal protein 43 n=1 Tax=Owenia fusiformis TaxID=6347 RepID=A0A8J1XIN7_OWEFU|nr:unnamed protein product [Owenia fusiformis]
MSADEDTELRDLVANTLETNGVLGKIRAQLRASVFLALEEQDAVQNKTPLLNQDLKKFIGTKEGRIVTSLVKEFLEHFNLEFSTAVFQPETGFTLQKSREDLARDLNIVESEKSHNAPLLAEVVKRLGSDPKTPRRDGVDDLSNKHISEAKRKFEQYDEDNSGSIDKDELRSLFADMFPHFHRNMLERYVTDEFRAIDKDFSNTIDFDEFLQMYKRLFVLCKSVVSHDISDITLQSPRRLSDTPSKIPAPIKKGPQQNGNGEIKAKKLVENGNKHQASKPSNVLTGADDHDDFFDEPVVKQQDTKSRGKADVRPSHIPVLSPGNSLLNKDDKKSSGKSQLPKPTSPSGMSSLSGLPSLTSGAGGGLGSLRDAPPLPGLGKSTDNTNGSKSPDLEIKAIDKRIADLGFEVPDDDDYEDDFQSSVSGKTLSARSDKSKQSDVDGGSIEEDIEEEILEDISIGDDLLKSSQSGFDDLTTDRTISQASIGFDYMEEIKT